ncbi:MULTISPECIES: ribonucleoside-diphosphate reductase subunit alpha [unclassified Campylobacter]|uniref:ribonucleoside-diphosphate reductase subunit alpha n=1 Tax=unclassified Campylobacter TaxID=2593542 RepID=UPI0022E9CFCA|nr:MULTISPECIES: ribonucleoside-diphosphate reductase subunit alpha [unclassified Campylobacter]MDA3080108.1 ribonucleoside-diphosphate reductase subunit alpha [Campylobacter sp. CS_NA2]MDA3081671.1 ribonucleoside-diphosphate reductase subunit alpha [Campylobacter sp. CS_NA1]MDA3086165.1 ribonucleoside-diphosphate reductase subunit alpha [Campylobacter sp. CS_ED1]MDA3090886.1 ribonucleoside-diphosphate reductase subunit alpha [Campylobacter sp. CS_ED2]WBR51156.1 ribonucleoside-diphosphate redu
MKVIKRNGRTEELDISKIKKYTTAAVAGIENVSLSELEVDAKIQFRDMITTEEIQQTLIKTAVDKIDIDRPNWTFVAARLFLYDLYHKVTSFNGYNHLREYFERGEAEGRIMLGLKEKYDLDDLNDYIKIERDLQFNYLGIKTLYDRYLIKDKQGKPIELPQHMFMAIAMFLAQNELDSQTWAKKFYDLISKFEVMLATPTLSNARTTRHQLSSCYVGSVPDNIEGIFDSYKEMALLSKFGGGIGWDWCKVRAMGGSIDGHKNAAGGIIPFLKITNDIAVAVDQLGTRKGAIAVYIEPWHMDINDFLDLRKNSGEERRRAHEIFPALWINDLFMKRLANNEKWTLFDPVDVADLCDVWGEEFEQKYIAYENDPNISKSTVLAKELWKKILTSYFETGMPFLCFKDNANRVNPNSHKGIIRSSNLCTEIFQNTQANHYKTKIVYADGSEELFEENEEVVVNGKITKKAKKITALDSINGKDIFIVEKGVDEGATAVCNLASVNLSKIHTQEDIKRVVPIAVRMLDNVIELNFYPHAKVKRTNLRSRAIGLGVMGEAQMLAEKGVIWGSYEHFETIDKIMENISYNAIYASSNLALEKGKYPEFEGSKWSQGIFPIDLANENAKKLVGRGGLFEDNSCDWDALRAKVKKDGMRNGYLMAIAPTSSISILVGTTQTIEPVYKRKWFEHNLSGMIPVVVPNLSPDTWQAYVPAYELDQRLLIKAGAIRQKWIDQGQSLNIFITLDKASGKVLNDIYTLAWELGIKSTYYLRSESPSTDDFNKDVADRSIECEGCQ